LLWLSSLIWNQLKEMGEEDARILDLRGTTCESVRGLGNPDFHPAVQTMSRLAARVLWNLEEELEILEPRGWGTKPTLRGAVIVCKLVPPGNRHHKRGGSQYE
jgi:hypothetical protein